MELVIIKCCRHFKYDKYDNDDLEIEVFWYIFGKNRVSVYMVFKNENMDMTID